MERLTISVLQILIQPGEDLVPPHDPILGLGDPVPFVGEPDITARHAPALKRGKHPQALGIGHPEIEGPVNHERRYDDREFAGITYELPRSLD